MGTLTILKCTTHIRPTALMWRNRMEQVMGEPMPLTTMADSGHHNKKRDIVRFFMQNEMKERIRCGVTNHALEVFKLDFDRRTDDPLTTFNKYRAHIESSASAKYDI